MEPPRFQRSFLRKKATNRSPTPMLNSRASSLGWTTKSKETCPRKWIKATSLAAMYRGPGLATPIFSSLCCRKMEQRTNSRFTMSDRRSLPRSAPRRSKPAKRIVTRFSSAPKSSIFLNHWERGLRTASILATSGSSRFRFYTCFISLTVSRKAMASILSCSHF